MSPRRLYAIAHFANEYHSGQSSRGYRLLCMAQRLLRRKGLGGILLAKSWIKKDAFYQKLCKEYGDKV